MAGGNGSQGFPGAGGGQGYGAGRFMGQGQGQTSSGLMPWDYQVPRPPMPAAPAMSGTQPVQGGQPNRGGGQGLLALIPLLAAMGVGPPAGPGLLARPGDGRGRSGGFGGSNFGGSRGGFGDADMADV